MSPITERTSLSSTVPPPPPFGQPAANGASPCTSSIDTFSKPSRSRVPTVIVPQSHFSVLTRSEQPDQQQMLSNWFDMGYPRYSPSILSDDYTISSPASVAAPVNNNNSSSNNNGIRWLSLFPSAPVVVERQAQTPTLLRSSMPEERMSSPAQSVISYATSMFFAN